MKTNKCRVCGEIKTTDLFYAYNPATCMACKRAKAERFRHSERGKEYMRVYTKTRYQKFKDKNKARAVTRNAVKTGKLEKPLQCSMCSQELPLDAHHDDYSKPFDVLWLCVICHKIKHGRIVDTNLLSRVVNPILKEE